MVSLGHSELMTSNFAYFQDGELVWGEGINLNLADDMKQYFPTSNKLSSPRHNKGLDPKMTEIRWGSTRLLLTYVTTGCEISVIVDSCIRYCSQAPVPLTIFRSNSKFDQNLKCPGLKYTLPITTKFCTRHDSVTVVTCAKFRCDWLSLFEIRALQILVKFRIRSKYR